MSFIKGFSALGGFARTPTEPGSGPQVPGAGVKAPTKAPPGGLTAPGSSSPMDAFVPPKPQSPKAKGLADMLGFARGFRKAPGPKIRAGNDGGVLDPKLASNTTFLQTKSKKRTTVKD